MNYFDFFLFAEEHFNSLLALTFLTTLGYLLIYRKTIYSIFDPFFLVVVIAGLSSSTVLFLFYNNAIKSEYFFQFVATELSFFAGFFLVNSVKFKKYLNNGNTIPSKIFNKEFTQILFYLTSVLHIFLQVLTYFIVGIPLLLDSRMSTFASGSGFGIVGRIIEVVSVIGIFLLLYRIVYCAIKGAGKFYNYFYLSLVIVFLLLSGSKTNLVFLVYYLFLLNVFMMKIKGNRVKNVIAKSLQYQKLLLYISIPLIFGVMYVQFVNSGADRNESPLLLSLAQRIISFGDIYYMTLPDDVINSMNAESAFLQLFKDPLGMLRIVPWAKLPLDCGIEVYQYHYPNGTLSGPNARYNYFAILYFSTFGQIVYCFIIGLITSIIRNTLFKILPNNIVFGAIYALFTLNLIYIYQDQSFTFARFFNIITIVPVLIIITLLIDFMLKFNDLKVNFRSK